MSPEVIHIIPINDIKEHNQKIKKSGSQNVINGEVIDEIISVCNCKPNIIYENGKAIIVHDAYDGRLGIEWANKILNK